MQQAITIFQVVVAAFMTGAILLQQQGTGLSTTFGGDGNAYRTKRGLEKGLVYVTIVLAALFLGSGVALLLVG